MGNLARFGVSLDQDLLEPFDELCRRKSYHGAGTLTLVYDHHKNDLSRRLVQIQHDDHDLIVTTLHVHLDHYNCLEVLVLKGEPKRMRALADKLIACRGVKHGTFTGTTTGEDLA